MTENTLISSKTENVRTLDYAVTALAEVDAKLPKGTDLMTVSLNVNGMRLAEVCELLLTYASVYENVDVDGMRKMADAVVAKSTAPENTETH